MYISFTNGEEHLLHEFKIAFKQVAIKVTGTVSIEHISFNFDHMNLTDVIFIVHFEQIFANWNASSLLPNPFAV